ncbi:flagellar hook-basal body protein [Oceanobacillus piezotolerans]|uniref:Flagellar hook-basal body protein n=1 Tax=Oceanobacillus piezotolerans TaxID=2448030 RepID=A0A498DG02_9BACI|nr:flagellar hook-basal body protein [Oceanobacillus piezotolerans]RLL42928.1 flagellar hook-basal body protein [Oceanobacillus piezotolerans]
MSRMTIQAAVTMNQLQNKLDLIGNNMANSQTTGYKSKQASFSSLLFQQIDNLNAPENAVGRLTPDGIRIGSGARLGNINSDMSQGSIVTTGRVLDTALLNKNYLYQVQVTENGVTETRYTRDGAFYLNPVNNNQDLMLTTSDGHPVIGENGPILIAEGFDSITIRPNGDILVERGTQAVVEGSLAIAEAVRPGILEATGSNQFRLPNLAELGFNMADIIQAAPANQDLLQSQSLEQSNVDMANEMAELIMTQRAYQFNARTISMGDQMMGLVNQMRS